MVSTYPLVTTKQFEYEVKKWLIAIKRRENVLVQFFPKSDRLMRLKQFQESQAIRESILGTETTYLFETIELKADEIKDKTDFEHIITNQLNRHRSDMKPMDFDKWIDHFRKNHINLVLIFPEIEGLWTPSGQMVQNALTAFFNDYTPIVSILGMSEKDITHPSFLRFLPDAMRLYENIFYYPLYSAADSLMFIRYMEGKWGIELKEEIEKRIIADCGGHFWLLKEAVRQCDSDTYLLYPGQGLQFRLDVIFKSFLPSEQSLLNKAVKQSVTTLDDEVHSLEYFKKLNFFDKNNNCTIKLFEDYILQFHQPAIKLELVNDHLLLNQVPIDTLFSRKEYRIIKRLLEKRGEIVSRDELARQVWPIDTEENYSDWAIDQLIARVRRRLIKLSLSPKLLQSVRGRGYLLNLT